MTGAAQVARVIVSLIRVTAPAPEVCSPAISAPSTVTAAPRLIEVCARIVPRKVEPAPSVADVPTFQKTLHDCADLVRLTLPVTAVVNVPVPSAVWKMKTASGSFAPSRTNVPDMAKVPEAEV